MGVEISPESVNNENQDASQAHSLSSHYEKITPAKKCRWSLRFENYDLEGATSGRIGADNLSLVSRPRTGGGRREGTLVEKLTGSPSRAAALGRCCNPTPSRPLAAAPVAPRATGLHTPAASVDLTPSTTNQSDEGLHLNPSCPPSRGRTKYAYALRLLVSTRFLQEFAVSSQIWGDVYELICDKKEFRFVPFRLSVLLLCFLIWFFHRFSYLPETHHWTWNIHFGKRRRAPFHGAVPTVLFLTGRNPTATDASRSRSPGRPSRARSNKVAYAVYALILRHASQSLLAEAVWRVGAGEGMGDWAGVPHVVSDSGGRRALPGLRARGLLLSAVTLRMFGESLTCPCPPERVSILDATTADAGDARVLRDRRGVSRARAASLHPRLPRAHPARARLLSWFLDSPAAPFGMHRMALAGKAQGKDVGMWVGPSAAAEAVTTLVDAFPACGPGVSVATDGTLYQTEVYAASHTRRRTTPQVLPLARLAGVAHVVRQLVSCLVVACRTCQLFFACVTCLASEHLILRAQTSGDDEAVGRPPRAAPARHRLGLDDVNPVYYETIKSDGWFHLDPHHSRPAVPLRPSLTPSTHFASSTSEPPASRAGSLEPSRTANPPMTEDEPVLNAQRAEDAAKESVSEMTRAEAAFCQRAHAPAELRTFHCEKVHKMPLSGLDPSMLLGFDEPPTWPGADDDDDMGLESVSDPEDEEAVDADDGEGNMRFFDEGSSSASHGVSSSASHTHASTHYHSNSNSTTSSARTHSEEAGTKEDPVAPITPLPAEHAYRARATGGARRAGAWMCVALLGRVAGAYYARVVYANEQRAYQVPEAWEGEDVENQTGCQIIQSLPVA
ncbi:hypothetical protein C8J57DRAFT_1484504 [Mycena rebaudengoi]|nr:hypothetical protein C8J57DRAFT_1484504 [Mycena rebaudengoi]